MLTLPVFEWMRPASIADVVRELEAHPGECLLVAGGTDAVPNMKHRLHEPKVVVSLAGVEELRGIAGDGGAFAIGARVTLRELAEHAGLAAAHPALVAAAAKIASPQIRNMGTVGGNVCLDTRCTYYNQSFFWREALGFCLKKDGTCCHVVPQGRRCVAAHSSDLAPVLLVLGAGIEIAGPAGVRTVAADAFFTGDGVHNNVLGPAELVTRVLVPAAAQGLASAYRKLRPRGAIDFPMLSVAAAARANAGGAPEVRVAVGALGSRAKLLGGLEALATTAGTREDLVEAVALAAFQQCRPLPNVPYDDAWRRDMVPVLVRRALREAMGMENA